MNGRFWLTIGLTLLSVGAWSDEPRELETPYSVSRDLMKEAQDLQNKGEYRRALNRLEFADTLAPMQAENFNLRGAIYLAKNYRDLDQARAMFNIARKIEPDAMPPRFNLAEVDYVAGNWAAAELGFNQILVGYPKLATSIVYLLRFKVVACMVKQRKFVDSVVIARSMYQLRLKIPGYYFAMGTIAISRNEKITAADYLLAAERNFDQKARGAYTDALIEAQFLDSDALKQGKLRMLPQP